MYKMPTQSHSIFVTSHAGVGEKNPLPSQDQPTGKIPELPDDQSTPAPALWDSR